jgi:hypothetical protein
MASSSLPVLLIACAASAVLSCARRTPSPRVAPRAQASAPTPLSRGEVHALAERHCASCHQGSVSREKPNALAVFDLDQRDWSARLEARQFSVFYQRMEGELDPATRARLLAFTERERTAREPAPAAASAAPLPGSSAATPVR